MTNPASPPSDFEFETLLNYLKRNRGFDFTGYKRSSLMRRVVKRMQTLGQSDGFNGYIEYLDAHPDEFNYLFDTILINVTTFFRDGDTWDHLSSDIIPAIIADTAPHETIRIWSAACASGEEAYSLAILFAEALGLDRFRDQVKIYATDVDPHALDQARQAIYSQRDVAHIAPELVEKYFEQSSTRFIFRKDMRRSIIFGRHDLMQDAPISRVDLLMCRNTLMYFNVESQNRILSRFHFALRETGFLVMGKAELLYTHSNLFTPIDVKRRVFKKIPQLTLRDHLMSMAQTDTKEAVDRLSRHVRLREAAFDTGAEAQIVVDLGGYIVLVNNQARSLMTLGPRDLNRPLRELDFYTRVPELRTHIQQAYAQGHQSIIKDVNWATESGEVRSLDVFVTPINELGTATAIGLSLTFRDLTINKRLQEKLEHTHQELETAYEELQSTNEELETTNEELQSTIEELETTNEELQSTNEELETINEELQSTNEEMHTINVELRERTTELNRVNGFLASILASLRGGVVVVDADFRVMVWSKKTEDLWGLYAHEVQNKNFLNLEMGLPVEQLKQPIRDCLANESDFTSQTVAAINRRGKSITCRVTCTPLLDHVNSKPSGVIMIMDEVEP